MGKSKPKYPKKYILIWSISYWGYIYRHEAILATPKHLNTIKVLTSGQEIKWKKHQEQSQLKELELSSHYQVAQTIRNAYTRKTFKL